MSTSSFGLKKVQLMPLQRVDSHFQLLSSGMINTPEITDFFAAVAGIIQNYYSPLSSFWPGRRSD